MCAENTLTFTCWNCERETPDSERDLNNRSALVCADCADEVEADIDDLRREQTSLMRERY